MIPYRYDEGHGSVLTIGIYPRASRGRFGGSSSFTAVAQLPDLWAGEVKALIFGLIAAVVASYKGLTAGGGPKGVGDAVNQSVVITFLLLFFVNFVLTTIYLQLVPAKGM